jgi:2-polyprenyl-3-methyl-5-hydroxy-6-metoxy-1,4-benzoquinol methylase
MDDLSITDERLEEGLHGLRAVNRWLGGYSALWSELYPYLEAVEGPIHVLDIGMGIGDIVADLIRRAEGLEVIVRVTGVDINPVTIAYADEWLAETLDPHQYDRIELIADDLFALDFGPDSFDLCTASLFLHHLEDGEVVRALRRMNGWARDGFVINDLHRTPGAYYGLQFLNRMLPVSAMVRHDGPLSILRGFRKRELERLATAAGCAEYSVEWHWAFRWTLSTIRL